MPTSAVSISIGLRSRERRDGKTGPTGKSLLFDRNGVKPEITKYSALQKYKSGA
jgi:hypothetical protein